MNDVRGPYVPLTVVAAKKPGHWIIRGWLPFEKPDDLRSEIERIVGILDTDIEWTTHIYDLPAYLVYGHGDIKGWGWPIGIYKFDCSNAAVDTYRTDPVCLRVGHGTMGETFGMAMRDAD